jgi:hypothetical protein
MNRKPKVSWTTIFLFSLTLQSLVLASGPNVGQDPQNPREASYLPEQGSKVTVLVHNYAHLPIRLLIEARHRAGLIFRKAGVEIEWADCPLNDQDPSSYPGCPEVSGATELFLRIFPKVAAKADTGGEAFVAARIANIFWSRVEQRVQGLNVPAPRFLAHTIAHELGHLLLGSNSHSPTGIMIAKWDAQAVIRICQEGLYFNRQQSELIRSELRQRRDQQKFVENVRLIPQR